MMNNYITTTAGVLGIIQSLLCMAWDVFFLFVCYQPLVFNEYNISWLAFFYAQIEEIQYGVNGVVIVSTIINFIWLASSVGALLSNQFSKSNASGIRIWIGLTLVVVFSDIAMTLFIISSSWITFEDLFRSDKKFLENFNTTIADIDVAGLNLKIDNLDNDVAYIGYTWFIAGLSRCFLISILINLPLAYLTSKRVREIRLNTQEGKKRLSKASSLNFFDNMGFAGRKTPNMYAESPIQVNEYDETIYDTRSQKPLDDKWAEPVFRAKPVDAVIPNRFRMSQAPQLVQRTESERRSSARNYALNIDAVPRASPIPREQNIGSLPNVPALRTNLSPINRNHNKIYPDLMPEIPDVDYDEVPDMPSRNGYRQDENPANNPLYSSISKPNYNLRHQRSPSSFQTFDKPAYSQMNAMNGNGPNPREFFDYNEHRQGNFGGNQRF